MADEPPRSENVVAVLGTGIMVRQWPGIWSQPGWIRRCGIRSREATQLLADAGATVAPSPRDAVRDARVVITMLPTSAPVDSVLFAGGVPEALTSGACGYRHGMDRASIDRAEGCIASAVTHTKYAATVGKRSVQ